MSTGKKKIKIELEDAEGGKYNLSLEGNLSTVKIQKVLQLVESLNISKGDLVENPKTPEEQSDIFRNHYTKQNITNNSIESKIWTLIENNFTYSTFTSSNIVESYEELYGEQLQLSLISTYLSRYHEKRKLIRSKRGKEWIYKLIRSQKNSLAPAYDITDSLSADQLNSHYPDSPSDNEYLKKNALTTVYDLHL
ncbi:MAG TPA: hypothetical protein VJR94_02490 [Candidatus Nitrosocosmicus sp.]|nr:hypothetical protein [Candidatus Nitrosocosmicus sp.]